jgi:hypothetical protein
MRTTPTVSRSARNCCGLRSARSSATAVALRSTSVTSPRTSLGNPYWIAYALWIAGLAFSKADVPRAFAAWDKGVSFVREQRVQFFEGFLARDAARLHTSDGEPESALVLFSDAIAAFHKAGNVPQLIITLASVPALFERLDRPAPAAMLVGALSREPSSFHHVPELGDLGDRVSRELGKTRAEELMAEGAALDLGDAAVYARRQIDVARRDPTPQARAARPGGLSRREIEVVRPRGRGSHCGRGRDAALHLVAHRRAPHPEHLYEDRCVQPCRGDALGRQAPGRRRRLSAHSPPREWVGARPTDRVVRRRQRDR